MKKSYDWLVIGGGFRSIVAAYVLAERGASVALVEAGKKVGGFLAPIQWGDYWIDRGPQFLDNFEDQDLALMTRMLGPGVLSDIGFSYASYFGGQLTDGFAIPDWRSKGPEFTAEVFADLLRVQVARQSAGPVTMHTFGDLLAADGGTHLTEISRAFADKFLRVNADLASPGAACMVPFVGRKVLFDQDVSLDLKKSPLLDAFLAAKKMTVNETRYNLYPKGKTLESVRVAMIDALARVGVETMLETQLLEVSEANTDVRLSSCTVQAENVYFGCDSRDSEKVLKGTSTLADLTSVLPEVFHVFEVPSDALIDAHYVVDFDLDHASSRTTNFANYMGDMEENGVVCIEQPIRRDSAQWDTPDMDQAKVFAEAQAVGSVTCERFSKAQSLRVTATYKVPLVGFEEAERAMIAEIQNRFAGRVTVAPFALTRKENLDEMAASGLMAA